MNSTWQRLSTSTEAVGLSLDARTVKCQSYFIEKSQNSVDSALYWL